MAKDVPEKQKKFTPKTAWKPGQSGNPAGRPKKGQTITDLMTEYLEQKVMGKEITHKQEFIKKVYDKAIKDGDIKAMRLIWNYIDGMPKQSLDLDVNDNRAYPELLELIHSYVPPGNKRSSQRNRSSKG